MTAIASGSPLRRLRAYWLPAALAGGVFAVLLGIVILSQRTGDDGAPPQPPAFTGLPSSPLTVMDVKQRASDVLTLTGPGGEVSFAIPDGASIERLRAVEASDIAVGDTINVVGIPNEVLSFSIHFVFVMANPAETVDSAARSTGGFAGHEATLDPADRPIISGVVESVAEDGNLVTFRGPGGPATLRLNEAEPARLYRLERVDASSIVEGDRIAAAFGSAVVSALLVMPGD